MGHSDMARASIHGVLESEDKGGLAAFAGEAKTLLLAIERRRVRTGAPLRSEGSSER